MDLFRFTNPTAPTKMEQGVLISELTSKMWVERYRDPGEFTVKGQLESGIRSKLPIGSFISHTKSDEIMIVEDHQLTDDGEGDIEVTVTGRSFESYFEQRGVGSNRAFPTSTTVPEYTIGPGYTWSQAINLLKKHTYASELVDDDNAIPYFEAITIVSGTGEREERVMRRGPLSDRLKEILEEENLGIRVIRPGRTNLALDDANMVAVVHKGTDRSATVLFSHESGQIERADYLWSNKKLKNCAYIFGKWVDVFIDTAASGYSRRMLVVDASDIDQGLQEYPTGVGLEWIRAAMLIRGQEALGKQKEIALSKAEISEERPGAKYRQDYWVGDIVSVHGNYNESSKMRVTEHVEIEDEEGVRGYPTLELEP